MAMDSPHELAVAFMQTAFSLAVADDNKTANHRYVSRFHVACSSTGTGSETELQLGISFLRDMLTGALSRRGANTTNRCPTVAVWHQRYRQIFICHLRQSRNDGEVEERIWIQLGSASPNFCPPYPV